MLQYIIVSNKHIIHLKVTQCYKRYNNLFSPVDGHLSYFQFWAIPNVVAMIICIEVFVWMYFHFSWVNT